MANIRQPRHGSMQFWPRVRAKRETPRVRMFPTTTKTKVLGFAGYKAGMTQVLYTDNQKNSLTKGQTVSDPVTIIECPPLSVIGARLYKTVANAVVLVKQMNAQKVPAEVSRRLPAMKKPKATSFDGAGDFDFVRLVVATQPKEAGFGKKTSDIFELAIGGSKDEQLAFAKEQVGKTISITDVFAPGDLIDAHAVSKGKGMQGPVKRFGVALRRHKSEKTKRGPASLGPWCGQGHVMYRVAHAGKMGYHLRTDLNKKILLIDADAKKINPKGGIVRYGNVKSTFVLVKGSVTGAKKRLVAFTLASRPNKKFVGEAPAIEHIVGEAQN